MNIQLIANKPTEYVEVSWKGNKLFKCYLTPRRYDGTIDELPVLLTEDMKNKIMESEKEKVEIYGHISTENKFLEDGKRHLIIVVIADWLYILDDSQDDKNFVEILEAYMCKKLNFRITSISKYTILDVIFAVNYEDETAAFIPAIVWNKNAINLNKIRVGNKMSIRGRLQSREYKKISQSGEIHSKTAYELSVISVQ